MSLRLYIGPPDLSFPAVDFRLWAHKKDLQNAQNTYTSADSYTVHMDLLRVDDRSPLPFPPDGGMVLYYIDYDPVTPANSRMLFTGTIMSVGGTDPADNVHGEITLQCATPQNRFNHVMEYVAFSPDPTTGYPDDRSRVLQLGALAHTIYPEWDWTSGISPTPSVTYPAPPIGEPLTEYEYRTVAFIMNDLATDPGRPGDTGYPVPTRHWWISARLNDDTDPTAGVTWVLNYQGVNDIPDAPLELKDRKDSPTDTAIIYGAGARWANNFLSPGVIRRVQIAGPLTQPTLCTWQLATNVAMGHGHITKIDGTDGAWDAGAISKQRIIGDDWDATAIVQEFYLGHHQFQLDDSDLLGAANTLQQTVNYYPGTSRNTFGTRGWQAALIARDASGVAVAVWDCRAATCILREHFTLNRAGQGMAFRLTDADNFYRVENTGSDYALIKRQGGTETSLGTCGVSPLDGDQVKVFILGSQIQVYITRAGVPEAGFNLQVTGQTFNQHATMHGLYGNPAAAGNSPQMRFYDFQCTTFFSDDAFGLTTLTSVTDWVDLSYGFVKNNNGTLSMNEGGVVVATSDYSYNDKLIVATASYFDHATASYQRMVQWIKVPAGAAEEIVLHERLTGVVTLDRTHPWYVGFAGSDLGSTLNNISLRKQYANLFVADTTLFGTVHGDWPANGLIQSDELDTYVKRQTRADAIFRAFGQPNTSLNCTIGPIAGAPPYRLGDRVMTTNRQAGWLNGTSDTRKALFVTGMQRVETPGKLTMPSYNLTLESQHYDTDLNGQRHLLRSTSSTSKPATRGAATQSADDPTVFYYPDPTGDQNYGDYMETQLARIDSGAYANAEIPLGKIAPDATAVQLDKGQLVPGAQYVVRSRNAFNSGIASDWSESAPFVAPSQSPYTRPYSIGEWIGNGTDPISAGSLDVIPVPESGEIQSWELSSYDNSDPPVAVPADIEFDVLYADADAFRTGDVAALTSITGTDAPTLTAQPHNDSVKLTGWTKTINAGGRLMFVVKGTPTATKVMINLPIRRKDPV